MKPPSRSVFHPYPACQVGQVGLWRNRMGRVRVGVQGLGATPYSVAGEGGRAQVQQ